MPDTVIPPLNVRDAVIPQLNVRDTVNPLTSGNFKYSTHYVAYRMMGYMFELMCTLFKSALQRQQDGTSNTLYAQAFGSQVALPVAIVLSSFACERSYSHHHIYLLYTNGF